MGAAFLPVVSIERELAAGSLHRPALADLSVRRLAGTNVPVSGGAYFRIYPYALTRANLKAMEQERRPAVFYIHPWELDPAHPVVRFHWKAWLTHYVNLGSTGGKLRRLLREFSFAPLGEVLDDELGAVGW